MKGYKHVLLAMGLSAIINGMLYPILSLYVYNISEDFFLVGLIMALPFLAAVPMSFVWGMVSDRIGSRRIVIIITGCIGASMFFIFPFVDTTGLIILRLVQVAFLTSMVLLNAMATEFFPKRKGTSIGDLALVGAIGQAGGALAAGILLPSRFMFIGSDAVTLVFSIAGIVTILASLSLVPMKGRARKAEFTNLRSMLSFGERRGIFIVSLVALIMPLSGYLIFSVFPVYLKSLEIPWDSTMVAGVFTALSAITGIFASGIAGRACDRYGRKWVLVGSGAAYFLVWVGMGLTRQPLLTAILWAIPVWSFFYVSAITMVSDMTKPEERGRGIGLVNSSISMGAAAGSILAGYVLSREVMDNTFFLAAIVALVGMFVALAVRETLMHRPKRIL
ncbi:MAG: MFS transporter [Thermoplasmata archaeon]|nr:MFS transporter [Thermoplasmata archaeon]